MNATIAPIVSVVIPMFNVERYIEQAIDSVLAQTYSNFEIICVDDGCFDGTLDRVHRYSDKRIRIVRQENKGLAAARNAGIDAALGMYVALLDADDFWAPKKLELHVRHLQFNPDVGVSYSASIMVDEQGRPLGVGQYPKLRNIRPQDIFCRNPVGNGSSAVIRRTALAEVGVPDMDRRRFRINYFDPEFRQSEDVELWLRIALKTSWKFEGIKQPLTFYRINSGGLSADVEKQFDSWRKMVTKNMTEQAGFFAKYTSLAEAYQSRYLARRALQSGESVTALKLVHRALLKNPRILVQEPVRTLVTYGCSLLSILPNCLYKPLQNLGMKLLGRYKIS